MSTANVEDGGQPEERPLIISNDCAAVMGGEGGAANPRALLWPALVLRSVPYPKNGWCKGL